MKEGRYKNIKAADVHIGDLIFVENGETFPADLIMLASSSSDGTCYVDNSSMDGEKTLKKRSIPTGIDKYIVSGQKYDIRPPVEELIFIA